MNGSGTLLRTKPSISSGSIALNVFINRVCVAAPAADEPMNDEEGGLHKDQRHFPSREGRQTSDVNLHF